MKCVQRSEAYVPEAMKQQSVFKSHTRSKRAERMWEIWKTRSSVNTQIRRKSCKEGNRPCPNKPSQHNTDQVAWGCAEKKSPELWSNNEFSNSPPTHTTLSSSLCFPLPSPQTNCQSIGTYLIHQIWLFPKLKSTFKGWYFRASKALKNCEGGAACYSQTEDSLIYQTVEASQGCIPV